jgi:ribosomal protein S18 acetylase RimI-like enzyme
VAQFQATVTLEVFKMSKAEEPKVSIRRMIRSDIHEVLALNRIITGSRRDVIKYEDLASANPGTPPDLSFVAEIDGRIVGFSINRSMYLMVPLTEVCIIHAIFIHPDYQGRGIGSKLIQALLEYCQAEGIGTVRSLIPRANKELRALVERHGFQRSRIINFDRTFES